MNKVSAAAAFAALFLAAAPAGAQPLISGSCQQSTMRCTAVGVLPRPAGAPVFRAMISVADVGQTHRVQAFGTLHAGPDCGALERVSPVTFGTPTAAGQLGQFQLSQDLDPTRPVCVVVTIESCQTPGSSQSSCLALQTRFLTFWVER